MAAKNHANESSCTGLGSAPGRRLGRQRKGLVTSPLFVCFAKAVAKAERV